MRRDRAGARAASGQSHTGGRAAVLQQAPGDARYGQRVDRVRTHRVGAQRAESRAGRQLPRTGAGAERARRQEKGADEEDVPRGRLRDGLLVVVPKRLRDGRSIQAAHAEALLVAAFAEAASAGGGAADRPLEPAALVARFRHRESVLQSVAIALQQRRVLHTGSEAFVRRVGLEFGELQFVQVAFQQRHLHTGDIPDATVLAAA